MAKSWRFHTKICDFLISLMSCDKGYSRKKHRGGGETALFFYPTIHGIQFPPTQTTHVIREFRTPTTHRIQFS